MLSGPTFITDILTDGGEGRGGDKGSCKFHLRILLLLEGKVAQKYFYHHNRKIRKKGARIT